MKLRSKVNLTVVLVFAVVIAILIIAAATIEEVVAAFTVENVISAAGANGIVTIAAMEIGRLGDTVGDIELIVTILQAGEDRIEC